jgi:hypothetical protein
MMDKKGAIEFSMTTIMVIIIGVAVLALGLTWIRGTFTQVGDITDAAFESAKDQLRAELTSSDPLGISPSTLSLKPGESTTVAVGFLNGLAPPSGISDASISVASATGLDTPVIDGSVKQISPGEVFNWRTVIKASSSATPGTSIVTSVKITSTKITREKPLVVNII